MCANTQNEMSHWQNRPTPLAQNRMGLGTEGIPAGRCSAAATATLASVFVLVGLGKG